METRVKDMTSGKPLGMIFTFALPLMLGNIFQQLYVVVDTMVVGQKLGVSALASLGAADWTNWMVLGIASGFPQGFAIPIAQRFGARDYEGLRKTLAGFWSLAGIMAVLLCVISEVAALPLLHLLKTPEDVLGGSILYLRIAFAGAPVIVAYNTMASILRSLGNSKAPLTAMVIAAFINIGLDLLFVMVFGWGIAGAAVATVIAQVCSCIYCFLVLQKITFLRLSRSDWDLDKRLCLNLLKLGTPIAFQNMVIAVGGMVIQSVVNGFGYLFIAGFTATNKLYGVLEVAATSYGFSMTTYAGQNLGAGKIGRIKQGMRSAILIAVGTSVVISIGMILFGRNLLGMFISGTAQEVEQAMTIAYQYLMVLSYPLVILYLLHVYRSALMGLGDTVTPMISGVIEFAMRILCAMLLPAFMGAYGIYTAEVAAWTGAALILIAIYYYRIRKLDIKFGASS